VVLSPETEHTVTDTADARGNRVDTMVREKDGYLYVFAVRLTEPDTEWDEVMEPDTLTVTFTADVELATTAEVFDEARTIAVSNNGFTDAFGREAVHIYKIALNTGTPTATLTASPSSITEGESSTLTWSSTDATTCLGTGFSTGGATSGSTSVSPSSDTTYTLTCTGDGGTGSDTATVTVTSTSTLTADFNADNTVNIFDYNLLLTYFGTTASCGVQGDADNDCDVDIFDYNTLLGEFGMSV
jgi:hypothetical protein